MDRFQEPTERQLTREQRQAGVELLNMQNCKLILQIHMTQAIREAQAYLGAYGLHLVTELEETFLAEKSPFGDIVNDLWAVDVKKLEAIKNGDV